MIKSLEMGDEKVDNVIKYVFLVIEYCMVLFNILISRINEYLFKILCNILEFLGLIFCWWGLIF